MFADPYDSEDRIFPFGPAIAAVLLFVGAILLIVSGIKPSDRPAPPGPLVGCYSAVGAPDLMVDQASITVLQNPPLKVQSSIRFIKNWTFETDRWLDLRQTAQGNTVIELGSTNGELLQVSHEGEFGSPVATFELFNARGDLAIRYVRSGDKCGSHGGGLPAR